MVLLSLWRERKVETERDSGREIMGEATKCSVNAPFLQPIVLRQSVKGFRSDFSDRLVDYRAVGITPPSLGNVTRGAL